VKVECVHGADWRKCRRCRQKREAVAEAAEEREAEAKGRKPPVRQHSNKKHDLTITINGKGAKIYKFKTCCDTAREQTARRLATKINRLRILAATGWAGLIAALLYAI